MRSLIFILFIYNISFSSCEENNACYNMKDYLRMENNPNCFYEPDTFAPMPEILMRHVGYYETYDVVTEDGYILKVFRLPRKNPKGTIILQHPITTDSIIFVSQSNESLAFTLWNAGYDVWLPNHRGTYYTRRHVSLKADSVKFWDFTFHEIGVYDYSAICRFVKKKTSSKNVIFIGHSMSTTSALIYASMKPEESKDLVKLYILLSPTSTFKYATTPIGYFAKMLVQASKNGAVTVKPGYILGFDTMYHKLFEIFVKSIPFKRLATLMLAASCGWSADEFDPKFVNLLFSLFPRGASFKSILHYAQLMDAKDKFQLYDYGKILNLHYYQNVTPPLYPIEKIETPFYFIYSIHDTLVHYKDVEKVYRRIKPDFQAGKHKIAGINHVDYLFGRTRIEKVNKPIMNLIEKWTIV